MRTIIIAALLVASAAPALAGTAYLKRHYVSGMNRICIYDHMGSQYIMTIKATMICPLSVRL